MSGDLPSVKKMEKATVVLRPAALLPWSWAQASCHSAPRALSPTPPPKGKRVGAWNDMLREKPRPHFKTRNKTGSKL